MHAKTVLLATALAVLGAALPARVAAVSTDSASMVTYDHFEDGEFANISIPAEGGLRLAPALERVAKLEAAVVWRAVAAPDGTLYVGTGNNGKVFKVTPDGKAEMIFQPEEVLTRALALDAQGNLYVGTSPDGRVYRLAPGGRPEIYFDPKDTYIWDLAFDKDGRLYVATGAKGRIYRLPPDYKPGQPAEVYFETDRTHVFTLAFAPDGALLAGAGPKSLVYRIKAKDDVSVIASPGSEEITAVYGAPGGAVYYTTFNKGSGSGGGGSGLSGASSGARGTGASSAGGSGSISISVDDDGDLSASPSSSSSTPRSSTSGTTPGRSQLQRVSPDGYVETVWTLAKTGIFTFLPQADGQWLLGSDQKGRLFRATGPNDWELLQQLPESEEVSVLLPDPAHPGRTFVLSSNPAQIFRLGDTPAASGNYTCAAFDADQNSRWGALRALARPPMPGHPLAGAKWETRAGFTPKPDTTWSDWKTVADDGQVATPPGRFFQYRVTLTDPTEAVRSFELFFQNFNAPPVITSIGVVPVGVEVTTPASSRPTLDLRQLADGSGAGVLAPPPARPQIRLTGEAGGFAVGWRATDPNDDTLLYTVQLRAVGESKWVTLGDELTDPVFSFSSRGFADGYYEIRVTATDKLSNPPGQERTADRISLPFLIDNTPPEVALDAQSGDATAYTLTFRARDAASLLVKAQYMLDGQPAKPVLPDGAIFDQQALTFHLRLERLKPGPHSVVFEVTDEAQNTGAAKVTFETP